MLDALISSKGQQAVVLPHRLKKSVRSLTSSLKLMPNFIIIGAQKCGTTSLFEYLTQHPLVLPPIKKEIGFFDFRQYQGLGWYRSHFPSYFSKLFKLKAITGEASTGYICHPHAPRRIAEVVPQVKLIVLLRNPVDRAYSHYLHTVRIGKEPLSFEQAIAKEDERLPGVNAKMLEDENYYNPNYRYYSYLSRGNYLEQLKPWFSRFERQQFLILSSEEFYADPAKTYQTTLDFLELPAWKLKMYETYNRSQKKQQMLSSTKERLVKHFKPSNERLYEYLGRSFNWDKSSD